MVCYLAEIFLVIKKKKSDISNNNLNGSIPTSFSSHPFLICNICDGNSGLSVNLSSCGYCCSGCVAPTPTSGGSQTTTPTGGSQTTTTNGGSQTTTPNGGSQTTTSNSGGSQTTNLSSGPASLQSQTNNIPLIAGIAAVVVFVIIVIIIIIIVVLITKRRKSTQISKQSVELQTNTALYGDVGSKQSQTPVISNYALINSSSSNQSNSQFGVSEKYDLTQQKLSTKWNIGIDFILKENTVEKMKKIGEGNFGVVYVGTWNRFEFY